MFGSNFPCYIFGSQTCYMSYHQTFYRIRNLPQFHPGNFFSTSLSSTFFCIRYRKWYINKESVFQLIISDFSV